MSNLIRPTPDSDHTDTMIKRVWAPAVTVALAVAGIPMYLDWPVALVALGWILAPIAGVAIAIHLSSGPLTPAKCPGCRRRLRNGQRTCHKCSSVVA